MGIIVTLLIGISSSLIVCCKLDQGTSLISAMFITLFFAGLIINGEHDTKVLKDELGMSKNDYQTMASEFNELTDKYNTCLNTGQAEYVANIFNIYTILSVVGTVAVIVGGIYFLHKNTEIFINIFPQPVIEAIAAPLEQTNTDMIVAHAIVEDEIAIVRNNLLNEVVIDILFDLRDTLAELVIRVSS